MLVYLAATSLRYCFFMRAFPSVFGHLLNFLRYLKLKAFDLGNQTKIKASWLSSNSAWPSFFGFTCPATFGQGRGQRSIFKDVPPSGLSFFHLSIHGFFRIWTFSRLTCCQVEVVPPPRSGWRWSLSSWRLQTHCSCRKKLDLLRVRPSVSETNFS